MALDWIRIEKALRQEARRNPKVHDIKLVIEELKKMTSNFPDAWWSRSMCIKIGRVLMTQDTPTILAPCCPDYTHSEGTYDFRSLNGEVSLLTRKHFAFLEGLEQTLPRIKILFLMADHEADDDVLCRAVGKTREQFIELVNESIMATQQLIDPKGWRVQTMTSVITDLVEQEQRFQNQLLNDPETRQQLKQELVERHSMYQRIAGAARTSMGYEEILERTAKTASQYLAMGNFAAEHQYLVVNHTTTNLGWYLKTGAAIIHNPVRVY